MWLNNLYLSGENKKSKQMRGKKPEKRKSKTPQTETSYLSQMPSPQNIGDRICFCSDIFAKYALIEGSLFTPPHEMKKQAEVF